MNFLQIAGIIAIVLFVCGILIAVAFSKWFDSKLPYDVQDMLDEADEDVANRARLGGL